MSVASGTPWSAALHATAVAGQSVNAASLLLKRAGLTPGDVLCRVVAQAQAGTVLETFPGAGATVRKGSRVRIVAGATVAPTPAPVPTQPAVQNAPTVPGQGHKGKHH